MQDGGTPMTVFEIDNVVSRLEHRHAAEEIRATGPIEAR